MFVIYPIFWKRKTMICCSKFQLLKFMLQILIKTCTCTHILPSPLYKMCRKHIGTILAGFNCLIVTIALLYIYIFYCRILIYLECNQYFFCFCFEYEHIFNRTRTLLSRTLYYCDNINLFAFSFIQYDLF